jgi:hypothetical protein
MGTPFNQIPGLTWPVPSSLGFLAALTKYLTFRVAECPLTRSGAQYFVRVAARAGGASASDSNDGRDGIGFALSGAAYTASTQTITKTNAFTSYVWTQGDLIYSATLGGLYKIVSRTDASNIVLAVAADSYQGTLAAPLADVASVASSSGPFLTISHAVATWTTNTAIRLNRGDTWYSDPVGTFFANTTARDFGNPGLPLPRITKFATALSTSGWALATGLTVANATTAPSSLVGVTSGGTLADGVYTIAYSWRNSKGETTLSSTGTVTITGGGGAGSITGSTPALATNATGSNVYITTNPTSGGQTGRVTTTGTTSFTITSATPTAIEPAANTTAATLTFAQANTNSVAYARELNDIEFLYTMADTLAHCEATVGSVYSDGTSIYVNPRSGSTPASDGRTYEAVYTNSVDGALITNVDNVRIDSILFDGWGAQKTFASVQNSCIRFAPVGAQSCLVTSVEAYVGGFHEILQNASNSGGIFTVVNCKTGLQLSNNSTQINCFAGTGGQEYLYYGNECVSGDVYCIGQNYASGSNANSGIQCYGHTSSGSPAWGVMWKNFARPQQFRALGSANNCGNGAAINGDIANATLFLVEDHINPRTPNGSESTAQWQSMGQGVDGGSGNLVLINCNRTFRALGADPSGNASWGNPPSTPNYFLNCTIVFDMTNYNFPGFVNIYSGWTLNGQTSAPYLVNCLIKHVRYSPGQISMFDVNNSFNNTVTYQNTAAVVINSILAAEGPSILAASVGLNNSATQLNNNAYVGLSQSKKTQTYPGWSADTNGIDLNNLPVGPPAPGTILASSSFGLINGKYTLGYDANWSSRGTTTQTRGPLEPISLTNEPGSGGGSASYSTGSASGGSKVTYSTGSAAT